MSLKQCLSSAQQRTFPNRPLLQLVTSSMTTSDPYTAQADRAERENKGRICSTIGNRVRPSWTNPNLPFPVKLTQSVTPHPVLACLKSRFSNPSPLMDHCGTYPIYRSV